ncbi:MAG: isocitrate/isopropylmalate family dehydrogenase [Acidobacteriota bacterium]
MVRVAVIPGDGIGPEVVKEAVQVLRTVAECSGKRVETVEFDLGAQLQGGLGIAASANVNPNGPCMFEPVHGAAPRWAGHNVANPFATILSVQMMLDNLGWKSEAAVVEEAVRECVRTGACTEDLRGKLGTKQAGEAVRQVIRRRAR